MAVVCKVGELNYEWLLDLVKQFQKTSSLSTYSPGTPAYFTFDCKKEPIEMNTPVNTTTKTITVKSNIQDGHRVELEKHSDGTFVISGFFDEKGQPVKVRVTSASPIKALFRILAETVVELK